MSAERPEGVVIVGAGVVGLFTAHFLRRSGAGPVTLLERGFLSYGASGRNGGGIRQQWESPETIRLARESIAAYRNFASEFGCNPWFRPGGYLFLAESEREWERLRRVHRGLRAEGLPARLLPPEEVPRIAPAVAVDGIQGASYLKSDGVAYPFPVVFGLYEAIRAEGAEVRFGVDARGLALDETGRIEGVRTDRGTVPAGTVVIAAGGWSAEFGRRIGLELPNRPVRHEICATEGLKPFLDPMVAAVPSGLYFSQTMRGEIVGGVPVDGAPGIEGGMGSSARFLRRYAQALLRFLPSLGSVRILRAWSGFYDETPDGYPIVGPDPRRPGVVHAHGLGGHGFMLAPAIGRRVARAVLGEPIDLPGEHFGVERFQRAGGPDRPEERLSLG